MLRKCTSDSVVSNELTLLMQEVDIGIVADVGTLQRLPKIVGSDSLVRELCYTARQMNASEAHSVGLVRFAVFAVIIVSFAMQYQTNRNVFNEKLIVYIRLHCSNKVCFLCRV